MNKCEFDIELRSIIDRLVNLQSKCAKECDPKASKLQLIGDCIDTLKLCQR